MLDPLKTVCPARYQLMFLFYVMSASVSHINGEATKTGSSSVAAELSLKLHPSQHVGNTGRSLRFTSKLLSISFSIISFKMEGEKHAVRRNKERVQREMQTGRKSMFQSRIQAALGLCEQGC